MKKSEIVEKMVAGMEYLKREDITAEQRMLAERKMESYRAMLREPEIETPVQKQVEAISKEIPEEMDDPNAKWKDAIREILNIPKTGGRRR